MKYHNHKIFILCFALLPAGCASLKPAVAPEEWRAARFNEHIINAPPFTIFSEQKITAPNQDITIYIEGDGHAWVSRYQLSTNPTPIEPLVRHWAMHDPSANVAYLARPCQFTGTFTAPCTSVYWDSKRFAPEIIDSMNHAVTQIKNNTHAQAVHLVGFSGGGAVAALIAARRDDVATLKTVAGNLDITLHSKIHDVSPLDGSLNPLDIAPQLRNIKQIHYIGGKDKNVPQEIAQSFVSKLPPGSDASIVIIPDATHNDGWN